MTQITDEIDQFRTILKQYDDGDSSAVQCISDLHALILNPILSSLEDRSLL